VTVADGRVGLLVVGTHQPCTTVQGRSFRVRVVRPGGKRVGVGAGAHDHVRRQRSIDPGRVGDWIVRLLVRGIVSTRRRRREEQTPTQRRMAAQVGVAQRFVVERAVDLAPETGRASASRASGLLLQRRRVAGHVVRR
jgi:hypothetical protein